MGKIFYIFGKSASGKDTIYKELLKREDLNLKAVIPYTTRPMRENEKEGVEYHFIDNPRFFSLKEDRKLIEYREYNTIHGIWRYMTVDDGQIDIENNNYLMIGTLESFRSTSIYFGRDKVVPFYIFVEDGERLERALKRERSQSKPHYKEMCRRFLADEKDYDEDHMKAAYVTEKYENDDLEKCINKLSDCIMEMNEVKTEI